MANPYVHSTHLSKTHSFSKVYTRSITLVEGVGVKGDIHASKSSKKKNLRQVHLIPYELFNDLAPSFTIGAGQLGENITTWGIDLLSLPKDSYLYFGDGNDVPIVQVTGLREPGEGVENFKKGLLGQVRYGDGRGGVVRRCGVMGVVVKGGNVGTGAAIRVVQPEEKYALQPV